MNRFKNIFVGSFVALMMFTLIVPPASAATIAELQAQISALMAHIAILTQVNTPAVETAVGDQIITTDVVKVRAKGSLTASVAGLQEKGSLGTVTGGPVVAGGYRWFQVNFTTGADGWVASNWLKDNSEASDLNKSGALIEVVDTKASVIPNTTVNSQAGTYTIKFEVVALDEDIYLKTTPNGGLDYFGRPFAEDSFVNFSIRGANGKVLDGYKLEKYASTIQTSADNVGRRGAEVYLVREGKSEEFTFTVVFEPVKGTFGSYSVGLEGPMRFTQGYSFNEGMREVQTLNFDEKDFVTPALYLVGSIVIPTTPVLLIKPVIKFNASLDSIKSGQSTTLSWNVKNAQRCVMQWDALEENVAVTANKVVNPTQTTTYKLWCANDSGTGKDGPSSEKIVTVVVNDSVTPEKVSIPTTKKEFVDHLYKCVLNRKGDTKGQANWEAKKAPVATFYNGFFSSKEYQNKNISNQDFVTSLYRCILFRTEGAGVAAWSKQLDDGKTRTQIINSFLGSKEYTNSIKSKLEDLVVSTTPSTAAYSLADVKSVDVKEADPLLLAVDAGYTLYTITLNSGVVHKVKAYGMQPKSTLYTEFTKTGYTGDVNALMTFKPTPEVKGASTDIYTEISMTLQVISQLLTNYVRQ